MLGEQAEVDLAALEMRINATQSQDSKVQQHQNRGPCLHVIYFCCFPAPDMLQCVAAAGDGCLA